MRGSQSGNLRQNRFDCALIISGKIDLDPGITARVNSVKWSFPGEIQKCPRSPIALCAVGYQIVHLLDQQSRPRRSEFPDAHIFTVCFRWYDSLADIRDFATDNLYLHLFIAVLLRREPPIRDQESVFVTGMQ